MMEKCTYTKVKSDGFGTTWKTNCGKRIYCEAPEEVGMSFAPLPTDDDCKFCTYCGKEIKLSDEI